MLKSQWIIFIQIDHVEVPMDHIPGASIWDPKGEGVLTIARKIKYTPCPQCPGTQIIEYFKYFIKLIYLLYNFFLNLQCFFGNIII